MKKLNQWINWRLELKSGESKPAKVPYCYATGRRIDAHNSSNWMSYDKAKNNNDLIGFVLTENDPYFCIDLDHALINNKWSKFSCDVIGQFPQSYLELSFSGDGLHIFGSITGEFPQHSKRGDGVELYTNKRFIAFTEQNCRGNYNLDVTNEFKNFVKETLPPPPVIISASPLLLGSNKDTTLWDSPDKNWLGPKDDDELIKKMLASNKSAISFLNKTAGIHELWKNNVPILAKTYPDQTKPNGYNASKADLALLTHLAFWTGKHLPRMIKLARMSSLSRAKWNYHTAYLKLTGSKACLKCTKVYRDPKKRPESQAKNGGDSAYLSGSQYLNIQEQVKLFAGCVYILNQHSIFTPKKGIMKPDQFNAWFGGSTFAITHEPKPITRKAFDAFTHSQGYTFPRVQKTCFRPELKSGEIIDIQGESHVNTYIPPVINFGTGRVDYFLFLASKLYPEKQDHDAIMCYGAACVQYPGVKFRWCPIVQGIEGNGKSLFMECIAYAVGEKYTHIPQADDLANKFNSWIAEKLLITVEEVFTVDKRETIEALKPMITNRRIPSQAKGKDTITIDNRANFFMCTNHKNALMKTKRDRRYAIFFTPQQEKEHLIRDGLTESFFKKFGNWLDYEGGRDDVAGFLKRYPIIDSLNPATTRLRAPETSSTQEAIEISYSVIHQEIQEAIDQGLYGFRGIWISSQAISKLLQSKNLARFFPLNKRRSVLKEIGYVPMPWYFNGRSSIALANEDGIKPILYIKESYQHGKALNVNDYINAQAEIL